MALYPSEVVTASGTVVTLWTNPDPTTEMGTSTVLLSDSILNYDSIRVYFGDDYRVDMARYYFVIGKMICGVGKGTSINCRRVLYATDTTITIARCLSLEGMAGDDSVCIPTKIEGFNY